MICPRGSLVQLTANNTEEGIVAAATPGCDYAELVWLLKNWLLCWVTTRLQHRDIFGPSSDQGRQGRCKWTYRCCLPSPTEYRIQYYTSSHLTKSLIHFTLEGKVEEKLNGYVFIKNMALGLL